MDDSRQRLAWNHPIPERSALAFCGASLVALTLLTFAPALNQYRLSDDFRLVGKINFSSALDYFHQTSGFGRNELRPIVLLTYAWDNWLWHENPFGYHLTNLLLHAACGMLLLLVLLRLTGSLLLSFAASTLFSVHPTHHSQVAWIAARDSVICLFFLLLVWLAHLYVWRVTPPEFPGQPSPRRASSRRLIRGASWAAFLLALGSYEGAVAFPFVLLAIEMLFSRARCWRQRIREALHATYPFFLILAVYLAWWLILFRGSVGGYDLDLTIRGMASGFYRMHYRLFHHIQHWLGVFYLVVGWLVWRSRKSLGPLIGASVALVWLGYLPFLPVHGYADRFGFLSAVGVALFLSLSLGEVPLFDHGRWQTRAILPLLLSLLLAGYYTNSTGRRLREWQEAGVMAESMVMELKALHPAFPPNATLVFDQIPPMHGNAYVFPTGFRAAVRERYRQELPSIAFYPMALEPDVAAPLLAQQPSFHFRYFPKKRHLEEVQ